MTGYPDEYWTRGGIVRQGYTGPMDQPEDLRAIHRDDLLSADTSHIDRLGPARGVLIAFAIGICVTGLAITAWLAFG